MDFEINKLYGDRTIFSYIQLDKLVTLDSDFELFDENSSHCSNCMRR